jgi:hypothetical protein
MVQGYEIAWAVFCRSELAREPDFLATAFASKLACSRTGFSGHRIRQQAGSYNHGFNFVGQQWLIMNYTGAGQ